MTQPPLLESEIMVRLRQILTADRLTAFVAKCRDDAAQRATALRALSAASDLPAIRAHAHNLIATSGTIGAKRAQALATSLQTACDNGEAIAACALAKSLAATLSETWDAMDEAFPPEYSH